MISKKIKTGEKERRKFRSDFKAKVALETLKEGCAISELCDKYQLHPNRIYDWCQLIVGSAHKLFENRTKEDTTAQDKQVEVLNKLIGVITIENNFDTIPCRER